MTHLVERLAELRRYLDHLYAIRERVAGPESLRRDLSLRNDVLFSLQTVVQLVIDISGEIGARHGLRFEDYTEAVRNLAHLDVFPGGLVEQLARLPGFRNVLIHEYITLDLRRAVAALHELAPVEEFYRLVHQLEEP